MKPEETFYSEEELLKLRKESTMFNDLYLAFEKVKKELSNRLIEKERELAMIKNISDEEIKTMEKRFKEKETKLCEEYEKKLEQLNLKLIEEHQKYLLAEQKIKELEELKENLMKEIDNNKSMLLHTNLDWEKKFRSLETKLEVVLDEQKLREEQKSITKEIERETLKSAVEDIKRVYEEQMGIKEEYINSLKFRIEKLEKESQEQEKLKNLMIEKVQSELKEKLVSLEQRFIVEEQKLKNEIKKLEEEKRELYSINKELELELSLKEKQLSQLQEEEKFSITKVVTEWERKIQTIQQQMKKEVEDLQEVVKNKDLAIAKLEEEKKSILQQLTSLQKEYERTCKDVELLKSKLGSKTNCMKSSL